MRFGISEISWMLPKILRMRRCFVWSPPEVLRGASIALVAICFPALCEDAWKRPAKFPGCCRDWCGALPRYPLQCVRSVRRFGPCPGEDGKSPGRTSPCGGAVYLLDAAHISHFQQAASLW